MQIGMYFMAIIRREVHLNIAQKNRIITSTRFIECILLPKALAWLFRCRSEHKNFPRSTIKFQYLTDCVLELSVYVLATANRLAIATL